MIGRTLGMMCLGLLAQVAHANSPAPPRHQTDPCRTQIDKMMRDEHAAGLCLGRVITTLPASGPSFCPPRNASSQELLSAVAAAADRQPGRLHEPYATFALEALMREYPCD